MEGYLSRGSLFNGISVQGGLCPGRGSVQGSLSGGDFCQGGLIPGVVCPERSLCRMGCLSRRGVSVQEISVQGISVPRVSNWEGLCQGGDLCAKGSVSRGSRGGGGGIPVR